MSTTTHDFKIKNSLLVTKVVWVVVRKTSNPGPVWSTLAQQSNSFIFWIVNNKYAQFDSFDARERIKMYPDY